MLETKKETIVKMKLEGDRVASADERRPRKASRYEQKRLRLLASRAQGPRVLDVGYAQMPNRFLVQAGRHITGIDLAEPSSDDEYDVHFVGDVFRLKELDNDTLYDCIVAGEFIEHVENPYDLIRYLTGSLTQGGRLLLSTPNPLCFPVALFELATSRRFFYTQDHTYYFCPRWMVRLLERAGCRVDEVTGVGLWPWGLPCPLSLSYQVIYVAARR